MSSSKKQLAQQVAILQSEAYITEMAMTALQNCPPDPLKTGEAWSKVKIYKEDFGRFQAIGQLRDYKTMNVRHPTELDMFDLLGTISKAAYALFIEFKILRDNTNNRFLYDTPKSKAYFSRLLGELKGIKLVKRVKVGEYMFNPYLLKCRDYGEAVALWSTLT